MSIHRGNTRGSRTESRRNYSHLSVWSFNRAGIGSELYAEPKVIDGLVPGIEIAPNRVVDDIMDALTLNVRDLCYTTLIMLTN
ncbi:MAG: hypothetical protein CM15mP49_32770 [Actinomycetota bacterium]|nr:MAG: hypothetical protein CM15mP49_32770 [Actinomycetota bacterium]